MVDVAVLFANVSYFLTMLLLKLFYFLQVECFSSVDIMIVSVMSSTTSQFSSAFHSFFNNEKTSAETETKLYFVSSIWDDDHIMRLDEKKGNAYDVIKVTKE